MTQGTDQLTLLGRDVKWPAHPDDATLESIPNQWPSADYEVKLICPEFTCICPKTLQPDFAKIRIAYHPGPYLVESKSLKLYLGSFRNVGTFHEFAINRILDDLVKAIAPRKMEVYGEFSVRGGISIVTVARWRDPALVGHKGG